MTHKHTPGQSFFVVSEPEPDLYSFVCWNAASISRGVFSVRGIKARDANIKALEQNGSTRAAIAKAKGE